MEYLTTRTFALPTEAAGMEKFSWFNMWGRRFFPYTELLAGDTVYWFDQTLEQLVWRTRISETDRFAYSSKSKILERYPDCAESDYFHNGSDSGYFITYQVKVEEKIDVKRPRGFKLPQLGWLRLDDETSRLWFNRDRAEDMTILDEIVRDSQNPVFQLLKVIDKQMQEVSPERVRKIVATTIRNDTAMVKALKHAFNYRCQFPGCGIQIQTKQQGYYIEVAHIEPVKTGGRSVLGNLLVLCPNHHKEFDYGHLELSEQSATRLSGILNGKNFTIDFILPNT